MDFDLDFISCAYVHWRYLGSMGRAKKDTNEFGTRCKVDGVYPSR